FGYRISDFGCVWCRGLGITRHPTSDIRYLWTVLTAVFACLSVSLAAPPAQPLTGFPFQDETLRFRVNWPTGASLGEARMQARRIEGGRWQFELNLDASVPGIAVTDRYRAVATAQLCSVEFERDSAHGGRKSRETVTFDQEKNKALRATKGGGSSEV